MPKKYWENYKENGQIYSHGGEYNATLLTNDTDLPGGSVGKESTCDSGDPGSIPGSGTSAREGNGNPF